MPYNDPPPMPGLGTPLQDLLRRMDTLEAQQRDMQNSSMLATDTNGRVRMVIGALNGPPATEWGVQIFDASGHEVVRLGQLNVSPDIYGLGVAPSTGSTPGTLQQVGGALYVSPPNADNVTNTSWTNFGSPSSVTAEIGPSGSALITVSCNMSTNNTANCEPLLGVGIDGGTPVARIVASVATAAGINGTYSRTYRQDGLSAGQHTFQLAYQVANPGQASFDVPSLVVQPL